MAGWWANFSARAGRWLQRPTAPRIDATAVLLAMFVTAAGLAAETEPAGTVAEVLRSSLAHPPSLTYTGVKVYWLEEADAVRAEYKSRVWNSADGRLRFEITGADGKASQTGIERDGKTYMLRAGSDKWEATPGSLDSAGRWTNVGLLERNYDLARSDVYFMARRCAAIKAAPRLAGRPELKVIIDVATSMPLSVEVSQPGGRGGYGYRFDEIKFGPFDESVFDVPADARIVEEAPEAASDQPYAAPGDAGGRVTFAVLEPDRIPEGFRFTGCRASDRQVTLSYGDGLSIISVYLQAGEAAGEPGGDGLSFSEVKRGDRSVMWVARRHGMLLTTEVSGTRATIMGEIPLDELLELAFSLVPARK